MDIFIGGKTLYQKIKIGLTIVIIHQKKENIFHILLKPNF